MLARLFATPCNLLVMDEPTNDLDVETLELLEERLLEFDGTLLLVSHDRAFLDNVVTSVLVMEGGGKVAEYVGGYSDWEARARRESAPRREPPWQPSPSTGSTTKPRKLGYLKQRELDALPALIEAMESELDAIQQRLSDPDLYRDASSDIASLNAQLTTLQTRIAEAYARWDELESASP